MHLGMHTDIRAHVHARACACLRACTCACTHTCTARTRTHMHMHAHLHACTHTRTHACARARIHARARTHRKLEAVESISIIEIGSASSIPACMHSSDQCTLRVVDRPDMRMMYMSPQIPSGRSSRKPINTFEHVSVTSFLASSYSFVCFSVYLADQCS